MDCWLNDPAVSGPLWRQIRLQANVRATRSSLHGLTRQATGRRLEGHDRRPRAQQGLALGSLAHRQQVTSRYGERLQELVGVRSLWLLTV